MKKKGILFIFILLLVCLYYIVATRTGSASIVSVSINGEQKQFDLSQDQIYTIQTEKGYNILQIQNRTTTIIEADCPDQICVQQKTITHMGEMIVCLPHKVVVEIK